MPLILGTNSIKDTGYDVANSLRFDSASADRITSPTRGTATSQKTGTFSWWMKKCKTGQHRMMGTFEDGSNEFEIKLRNDDTMQFYQIAGGSNNLSYITNRVFRDPSAWMHIVFAVDTTQSSASDRVKIYINGVEETSFSSSTNSMPQNHNFHGFYQGLTMSIGVNGQGDNAFPYDGYFAEWVYIDGQALDPTSFGEFDEDSSIWKPIDVSGLTFGNNGFYLDFENSGSLGADVSGNGNNFTVNNLTSVDQSSDSCTNNFATINPLDNFFAQATLSEGNTKVVTDSSAEAMNTSTFAMTKGKWYMEVDFISGAGARMCGITPTVSFQTSSHGKAGDVTPHTVTYIGGGSVQEGDGSGGQTLLASYSSYSTGDIIGIYMDLDNMKAYFSKNGTLQSSTGIDLDSLATVNSAYGTGHYMFFVGDNNSGSLTCEANFGNGFQSLSSAVTDDNGYGAFEYSPNITGDGEAKSFYSCCTKNLAEYG